MNNSNRNHGHYTYNRFNKNGAKNPRREEDFSAYEDLSELKKRLIYIYQNNHMARTIVKEVGNLLKALRDREYIDDYKLCYDEFIKKINVSYNYLGRYYDITFSTQAKGMENLTFNNYNE